MLDGLNKAAHDRFWEGMARHLARTGISPNQVTMLGFALVLANCALYLWHENHVVFALLLAIAFAFDALDGAVARLTGRASRLGGYLDAVFDRYQEIAVFLAIALVTGYWAPAMGALTGSLLISYNKARAAIEVPVDNVKWPDLMERLERIIFICLALLLDPLVNIWLEIEPSPLYYLLILLALLTHATAVQRFFRARRSIESHQEEDG